VKDCSFCWAVDHIYARDATTFSAGIFLLFQGCYTFFVGCFGILEKGFMRGIHPTKPLMQPELLTKIKAVVHSYY
jgi:hypothetical protein